MTADEKKSTRALVRPFEIVGFAAVLAVFVGLIVIYVTRNVQLMAIFAGAAFIAALMIFSLLALSLKPSKEDQQARESLSK